MTMKADVNLRWYLSYWFKGFRYLDGYPDSKLVIKKSGINRLKHWWKNSLVFP